MQTTTATDRKLAHAARVFRAFVTGDHACPACGGHDTEDNGRPPTSASYALRCCDCNEQWEPNE